MAHMDSPESSSVLAQDRVAREDEQNIPTDSVQCISNEHIEYETVDLYAVGHKSNSKDERETIPFLHELRMEGPKGEVVRVRGLFDDGALVSVMCSTVFNKVKNRLGPWKPSTKHLRMANGVVITSQATWEGYIAVGEV
jgi:hypothetical protein